MYPKSKGIPAASFFAGRSFDQERQAIPVIQTTDVQRDSVSTWSPAQAKAYRGMA